MGQKAAGVENTRCRAASPKSGINAEILGIDNVTGSLEEGKAADLVVLRKNPLDNITALRDISMVMAGNTLIQEPRVKRYSAAEAALGTI